MWLGCAGLVSGGFLGECVVLWKVLGGFLRLMAALPLPPPEGGGGK